jgi:hypothetical protein
MGQGCVPECKTSRGTVIEYIIENDKAGIDWTLIDTPTSEKYIPSPPRENDSHYNSGVTLVDIDEIDNELKSTSFVL